MDYYQILKLKEEGFKEAAIARKLSISRNTVRSYLGKSPEEFEAFILTLQARGRKLDPYREYIVMWLKQHPDLTGAQVYDWLQEKCDVQNIAESTVRSYVNEVRDTYQIPKVSNQRIYEAVPDLPMGYQIQVDFGQDKVTTIEETNKRLYFIAFVLSHSRFKYVEWLDRPFRTQDMIRCHENAFHYFGGIPIEMVYDQDAILSVSENAGDLILTAEFEKYRKARGFKIYLCRKSDPESKGKIEQVVKFVKYNFSKNRTYDQLSTWNESTLDWLERTGNHKTHHNTKKRPFEVHALEKQHLRIVSSTFSFENHLTESITRNITKDNVLRYEGNRYSVPAGTYHSKSKNLAYLEITKDGQLKIRLKPTGPILTSHHIAVEKGQVIRDPKHKKLKESKTTLLAHQIAEVFNDQALIEWFIDELRRKYGRYQLDQLRVLKVVIETHTAHINATLEKVKLMNLISANDFRDIAYSLHKEAKENHQLKVNTLPTKYEHLQAAERSEDYYANILTGGRNQ